MQHLDDIEKIKQLDPQNVHDSTAQFADQCQEAWAASSHIAFPEEYKNMKNIVVCGMGGSRFTPRTVKELYYDAITVPYDIVDSYTLPRYVREESVVIMSSYSGSTEETVSAGMEALSRNAKLTGIAKGGRVAEMLQQNSLSGYIFSGDFNPSGQPRIGGGYLLMGHIGLLKALGVLAVTDEEVAEAVAHARTVAKSVGSDVPESKNIAKQLAHELKDTHPFYVAADFLRGFVNGFANQTNETAKMISDYRYIPELNHHLMEGLKHPETLKVSGIFVFILSRYYQEQIKKRFMITQDVVQQQGLKTKVIELTGPSKLAQVLEAFTISSFTTFYMAMLYDLDPVAIPWVDYFKKELAK